MTVAILPRPYEVVHAAGHTRLLLLLRWRVVRGTFPKVMVWLGLTFLLLALFAASNLGYLVRRAAEEGSNTAAGQFAVNYIVALQRGDLGAVGAAALGSALAAALFSPFTGAANLALAAADDLTGLRPSRLHRYFDALVTASVSTIGFLQLLTLTAVASLLTLDGGRIGGLLFTWAVWPVLVLAAVAEGWAIELLHRKVGRTARLLFLAVLAAIIGAALLLDPNHGKTLFGLGTAYSNTIVAAGQGDILHIAGALGVLSGLAALFFVAGMTVCNAALSYAAVPTASGKAYRNRIPMSRHPQIALMQILIAQMMRTTEIRRPLGTILALGVPAVWFIGDANTTMTTLVIAVPLAVALAWGVNAFGVLGPGMTWLSSQPKLMRWLLTAVTLIQVGVTMTIFALCWFPPAIFGSVEWGDVAAVAAGTAVSTCITSRSASSKAVNRPFLARLGSRGDVIVPPLTAINYTLRFALWAGQFGVLAMSQDDRLLQVALVSAAVIWSAVRFGLLLRKWHDRSLQARVVATVAAA